MTLREEKVFSDREKILFLLLRLRLKLWFNLKRVLIFTLLIYSYNKILREELSG